MLTQKIIPLLSCLLAGHASITVAQTDSLLHRDYTFVKQSDPWLTHPNAAALTRFAADNIAEAELSLTQSGGRLTSYNNAPSATQMTAAAEAFYRASSRAVFHGGISYDSWTGRRMAGSAFMHLDDRYPFDIVEDSLTNRGRKHRDVYHLTGGVGVDLWQGYAIGAKIDYTAANYAKYKDLRHQNKLMALTASAGIYAPVAPWLSIGAHYTYDRQSESVLFSTNGKSEKVYKSLIDYGALTGLVEQFGNSGYTDKTQEQPLFEDGHGGSLQLEVRPSAQWAVYGCLSLRHAEGYYGRQSPYSITYTIHERDVRSAQLRLSYLLPKDRYYLDISYADELLDNSANTYRALLTDTEAPYYEYYDPTETGHKQWRNLNTDLTMHFGIEGEQPTWTVTAGHHWQQRTLKAYLYPYYRMQQLRTHELTASCTRHLLLHEGVLSLSLNGAFLKGSGSPYTDGTFVQPTTGQQAPATMPDYLWQDYYLLTAAQYQLGLSAKYAFLFPGTRLKTHISTHLSHSKANQGNYRDRTTASIAVGCTF